MKGKSVNILLFLENNSNVIALVFAEIYYSCCQRLRVWAWDLHAHTSSGLSSGKPRGWCPESLSHFNFAIWKTQKTFQIIHFLIANLL